MADTPDKIEPKPPPFVDRRVLRLLPGGPDRPGLLGGMRVRKKLVFLHTIFSLTLAGVLLIAMRPAVREVVERAEGDEARALLDAAAPGLPSSEALAAIGDDATLRSGSASDLGLPPKVVAAGAASPGRAFVTETEELGVCAAVYVPARAGEPERFWALRVRIPEARRAVTRLYVFVVVALLAVYGLVAAALEVLVLPQAVYRPIRRVLAADAAVRERRAAEEIIPAAAIPGDELGEIMRSRNETVARLRGQEAALGDALARLEQVANDLKRKNHLLEAARRNLADADRLASLGMMSAGIAHELNTPLAVLKGLVERLAANPREGLEPAQAALMHRVVGRLERLGDSLLDFARARPASATPVVLRTVVNEAMTLVRLDREAAGVELVNAVSESLVAECDADRLVQVLVNLVRNSADAIVSRGATPRGVVLVEGARSERAGRGWVTLTVTDDGPGIDSEVLPHLFEPFVSTRLDARGTGLGLAVAEGIVREHGGVLLARNRADRSGAVFEIVLPAEQSRPVAIGAPSEEVRA